MKRPYIVTAILIAALAAPLLFTNASALSPRHGGMHGEGHMGEERIASMMESLALDSTQREQIWAAVDEVRAQRRAKLEQLRKGHDELHDLVLSASSTPEQIRIIADRQGDAVAELITMRATTFSKVIGLLTPEQVAKLKETMAQRGRRSRGGWSD